MYYIKCGGCNKEFISQKHGTKYCCDECRKAAQKQRDRERNEKKDLKPPTVAEINAKARAEGMSYGKYMAMKYIEEQRNASTLKEL